MNIRLILRIISYILFIEALLMAPSLLISLFLNEWTALSAFTKTLFIILTLALILYLSTRKASNDRFSAREGLVTTGLAWIIMSLAGCLPFYFSKEIPSFINALFETVSGFTTTGASILLDIEAMSKGLLWWRSFTHWIGGMGVLVFLLAVVSIGGRNNGYTMHIMRAESPGPASGKIVPRMKETAKITYLIYIVLTLLDILSLITIGRMPAFDACCIAFGTAGTGGFGVLNDSMASYSSAAINITTVFMLLFSLNFSIYFLAITRKFREIVRDEELRFFLIFVLLCIFSMFLIARPLYGNSLDTLRDAAFTVATIVSTSGFATTNYDLWPLAAHVILIILMCTGACAGSTGGGIKQSRVLILIKSIKRNIHSFLNPSEVRVITYNKRRLPENIVNNVLAYLAIYIVIVLVSTLIIAFDGFDLTSTMTAVLATFNNIGPGLGMVGPVGNYFDFSNLSKIVMIFDMLAGRLEIMPIVILFSRTTWKKAS